MITDEDFIRLFNACAVLAKTPVTRRLQQDHWMIFSLTST
jgi:hypothetical protein